MTRCRKVFGVLVVCVASVSVGLAQAAPDYAKERADQAKELTAPYGWFSLVALDYLKPGVTTVGAAKDNQVTLAEGPAHLVAFEQDGGKVTVKSAAASLMMNGKLVSGGDAVVSANEDDASALTSGTLKMWAIDRGGKRYLRVKDSNAPALRHFHGLNWYAPKTVYRVEAKWIPYTSPRTFNVLNKLGQWTPIQAPGYVEFAMNGKTMTLVPMSADKTSLFFVFRDQTAPSSTYGGGRFLSTEGPSNGLDKPGTLMIDFNEATNPPCAYSPYATCPLASKENRLATAVPAGEKLYSSAINK